METDEIGSTLKALADQWSTPPLDAASLAAQSDARHGKSRRRRSWSLIAVTVLVSGLTVALLVHGGQGAGHSRPLAHASPATASRACCDLAPAHLPYLHITPLGEQGVVAGQPVLARAHAGRPVTVYARLVFAGTGNSRHLAAAALLVARPGTTPGVGGDQYDSYYASTRLAEGQPVAATAHATRILTVTTPANLPPGTYPVFYVATTGLNRNQPPDIDGPFNMSGQVGVIVLAAA
jgi:hypothetical protein